MFACVRIAVLAVLSTATYLPASSEEAPKTPEIVIEKQGNVTNITTGASGWAGVIKAVQKLRTLPADKDPQVIDVLEKNMDALPPAYIYKLARRTCASDPDRAIYLLHLAGSRARYDAYRCVDTSAEAGVTATLMSLPMPECNALRDMSKTVAALKKLRDLKEELFSSTASPWGICSHGMAAIEAGLSHKTLATSEWRKPESEWAAIRRKIIDQIEPERESADT
jgi:hypothetical protein